MVYSTSSCPHCKRIVRKQINPSKEIGNPFEKCPYCGGVYLSSYKQEWLTKSPIQRFFFFIQVGVWSRALIIPLAIGGIIGSSIDDTGLIAIIWGIGFVVWMITGYFLHKRHSLDAINDSLKRTENYEYVELLKKAHYRIYPIEGIQYANKHNDE